MDGQAHSDALPRQDLVVVIEGGEIEATTTLHGASRVARGEASLNLKKGRTAKSSRPARPERYSSGAEVATGHEREEAGEA